MESRILFPRNSYEWQEYVSQQRQIKKGNITNQTFFDPQQGKQIQETRPVAPASSSKNWNEAIWKGYNTSDDVSTMVIPRADQMKLALFSRYILKDPNAETSQYLQRAQERFQQKPLYTSVKKYVQTKNSSFNQGVVMNPTQQTTNGVPEELTKRYFELQAPDVPRGEIF
jgi:hypothetical protein